ncbi:hypothetical protein H0H93_009287 [Arthromyces matolae]|nr:hypothetical protein H0H93_009287 [Arthromyces matolae]
MPEGSEGPIFVYCIMLLIWEAMRRTGHPLMAQLVIFPRIFAHGSSNKSYSTTSCDVIDGYTPELEGTDTISPYFSEKHDRYRIKQVPYRHLTPQSLASGPLCVEVRGKALAIAAGHHCITLNLGLEANIIVMSRADFEEIVATDCPGSNGNKRKAERMRSFPIPSRFQAPASSPKQHRFINIFAAFVCESNVIVICDFSRILRIHIISSPHVWSMSDLAPSSQYWDRLWTQFPDGPDVNIEFDAWSTRLDEWRAEVLAAECHLAIVDVISSNASLAWGGFGRHLANDFLYLQAIYPGTPAYDICANDTIYSRLKAAIPPYMAQWRSPEYLSSCGGTANSTNPFAFNETANRNYSASHIHVFRRITVLVPADLVDSYARQGLLDPDHTIGEPYHGPFVPCPTTKKWLPVFYHGKPLEAYTIILAKPPSHYHQGPVEVFKDLNQNGYSTGIGPNEFHERKSNMINPEEARKLVKVGRPPKIRTGRGGRPQKPLTVAKIDRLSKMRNRRVALTIKMTREEEEEEEMEENKENCEASTITPTIPLDTCVGLRTRSRRQHT